MILSVFQRLLPALGVLFCTAGSFAQLPNRFEVVIDELMPDPSPPVQLPNVEFIELKNVSSTAFNLRNWKLSDGSTTATIATNFTLKPDSFVIVCPTSAVTMFASYGATLGVSNFPSLNNDADVIALYASDGRLVHAVGYNTSWYQNAVKSDGGWSLEMIDPRNPCAQASITGKPAPVARVVHPVKRMPWMIITRMTSHQPWLGPLQQTASPFPQCLKNQSIVRLLHLLEIIPLITALPILHLPVLSCRYVLKLC